MSISVIPPLPTEPRIFKAQSFDTREGLADLPVGLYKSASPFSSWYAVVGLFHGQKTLTWVNTASGNIIGRMVDIPMKTQHNYEYLGLCDVSITLRR